MKTPKTDRKSLPPKLFSITRPLALHRQALMLRRKTPSSKEPPVKYVLCAALILLQGCALLPYPFDQWEYPSPKLEAMVEQTQPVARLTTAEFRESWMRYTNQVVEVTGTITHIVNKGGAAGLMLDGDWVSCSFGRKQKAMVGGLRTGQLATFRGLVHPHSNGALGTCILISPA